jgi:nicotinic acid mononucleotide adenylyltransferase
MNLTLKSKIHDDPFYNELFSKNNYGFICNAGFFVDNRKRYEKIHYAIDMLCTPLTTLRYNLVNKPEKPCILLTTGSFCPIHQGHIEMMTKSKDYIEDLGYTVVQGYISPGHDEYISSKNKEQAIPVHKRIELIQQKINESKLQDWLSIDPWEGVFNRVGINFTEVIYRLEGYVKEHIKQDIPIFFVCGGDNARFALSFSLRGQCIVVSRPEYEGDIYKIGTNDNKNVHWIENNNSMSSTAVRKTMSPYVDQKKHLYLRCKQLDNDTQDLIKIFSDYFEKIDVIILDDQKKELQSIIKTERDKNSELISLDCLLPQNYNLNLCRLYDNFGTNKLSYVNRPNTADLHYQIKQLPIDKQYSIFDDDIHTGGTMRFAHEILMAHNIKIVNYVALNTTLSNSYEILDAHDFLIGDTDGGLVIELPNGTKTRVPYIYPFVCPFNRASINNPLEFSIKIWQLNTKRFTKLRKRISDCTSLKMFEYQFRFESDIDISSICQYYVNFLRKFVTK